MKIFRIIDKTINGTNDICWYMLPDSAIVRSDNPWFVPDFDSEFRLYPMVAVRIDRLGKSISAKFACRYYNEATICLAASAYGLLTQLRRDGLPWDRAVSFDKSCMMGDFIPASELFKDSHLKIKLGDKIVGINAVGLQTMINEIIPVISKDNTIKTGDLILLPANDEYLIPKPGDNLTAGGSSGKLLEIRIK